MDRRKRWIHAFVLCAIGIGIAGLQCGLVTRNYTLETEKLKEGQGMRLLMLSDLHSCIYGENQCQMSVDGANYPRTTGLHLAVWRYRR